jgi:hypothetical protein
MLLIMPKLQSFTIKVVDLDNVIQRITSKKPSCGTVKLIDDGKFIIVRDTEEMQICSVAKVPENENEWQP